MPDSQCCRVNLLVAVAATLNLPISTQCQGATAHENGPQSDTVYPHDQGAALRRHAARQGLGKLIG
jgi:hypothetical protein